MENLLREVMGLVCRTGKLTQLEPEQDIFDAGFESIDSLELLVELEGAFEVAIPDDRYVECRSAQALSTMIAQLRKEAGK